jgi:alkylation response protein AidB-like acyl-CoA dehydrogenase
MNVPERAAQNVRDLPLDQLLERVRAIVPLVANRARDAELARKPADDVIEALKASGVFRSFVPKKYGGYEIDPRARGGQCTNVSVFLVHDVAADPQTVRIRGPKRFTAIRARYAAP